MVIATQPSFEFGCPFVIKGGLRVQVKEKSLSFCSSTQEVRIALLNEFLICASCSCESVPVVSLPTASSFSSEGTTGLAWEAKRNTETFLGSKSL